MSAGKGVTREAFTDPAGDEDRILRAEEVGVDRRSVFEGNGVPDSRGGISSKRLVGNNRPRARRPGLFAKNVMDRRRGKTRMSHSVRKCIDLEAGKRDWRAECNAIEDCQELGMIAENKSTETVPERQLRSC